MQFSLKNALLFGLLSIGAFSCKIETETEQLVATERLQIVCTTGMLGDVVENIVGDSADVTYLCGPGVDPHLYQPTQSDLQAFDDANVIIYSGMHLEGKVISVLENLKTRKHVFEAAAAVPEEDRIKLADFDDAYDPHFWFDIKLWQLMVQGVSDSLVQVDPTRADYYKANTKAYLAELAELESWMQNKVAELPENKRIMITAHDAFEYFGRSTGFTVRGLQGISTTSGIGVKDVKDLVDFIVANEVRAIFVESSVPERALHSVLEGCSAAGQDVTIGGTLHSDALGEEDGPAGTYIGMIRHNVTTIVDALKPQAN